MGALHAGHGALIAASVAKDDLTIVSIFVNRLQFSPTEDYGRYPRSIEKDYFFCKRFGSVVVFAPDEKELLPKKPLPVIRPRQYRNVLCDPFRPGHFDGVVSIVMHLFKLIEPNQVYFGLKDFQQYRILQSITVRKFLNQIRVFGIPTVRHRNGLAMSSRNKYLSTQERSLAAQIRNEFIQITRLYKLKSLTAKQAGVLAKEVMSKYPLFKLQYFEILNRVTLTNISQKYTKPNQYICAWAITTTSARLIDNVLI